MTSGADTWEALSALEGVASAFAGTRDGIDALLRDRGLRNTGPDLTAEALLRGAHASAVLEGSEATLDEFRSGADDPTAQAAAWVSTGLLALSPVLGRAPLQALARLHALAGAGTVPADRLGRPADADAAARLQRLTTLLLAAGPPVPALLVAAVVHADLVTGAPFPSHNGLVARAAERLVLVGRGVDPRSVTVPEAGHLALRSAYESNLRAYRTGGRPGVHAWLLYAAEAYAAGAEASPVGDARRTGPDHASGIRSRGPDAAADT